MANPFFITGVVPEPYFCDRKNETERIIKYVRNKSNVLLTSSHRMGKTQLIRHIFNDERIKQEYHSFYVDIQTYPLPGMPQGSQTEDNNEPFGLVL